jgi:hypothetical protein
MILFDNPPRPLFVAHTLPVIDCHLAPQGIQALIGQDILANAHFVYNGLAQFYTLGF